MRRKFRLRRQPIVFEILEPRTLLSGDISGAAQSALVHGLQDFSTFAATLHQHAALAAKLSVILSSMGNQVQLPADLQAQLITPIHAYINKMAAAGTQATIQGIAAAVSPDTSHVMGQFADGEYLLTLNAYQTAKSTSQALDLSSDSAGVNLKLGHTTPVAINTTTELDLTFGVDVGADGTGTTFFIQPLAGPNSQPIIHETLAGRRPASTGPPKSASRRSRSPTILAATETVTITDPTNTDGKNYITTSEFQNTALDQLVTTAATGSANVTLPISTPLIAGATTFSSRHRSSPLRRSTRSWRRSSCREVFSGASRSGEPPK